MRLDELLIGTDNRAAVTKHALAFGLVSPYTSLIAIGTDVVVEGGVKHSVSVPVSVPSGMSWFDVKRETTKLDLEKPEAVSVNKKAIAKPNDDEEDSGADGEEAPMASQAPEGLGRMKSESAMDPDAGESAAAWLAHASETEIADVLWTHGEERMSRRIWLRTCDSIL